MRLSLFILLLLPLFAQAETDSLQPILASIKPGTVTILGEQHQNPESTVLFQRLVEKVIDTGQCPTVVLEIASNQQSTFDLAVKGRAMVSEIAISSIIDHPAYRKMLTRFVEMKRNGACLNLLAIDAGDDIDMDRDQWMASKIQGLEEKSTVLGLLGNLHTLQRVHWNHKFGKPSVAERLVSAGRSTKTYLQLWPDSCSVSRSSNFYNADQPVAFSAVKSTFSLINAREPTSSVDVVDGAIIWQCANLSLANPTYVQ